MYRFVAGTLFISSVSFSCDSRINPVFGGFLLSSTLSRLAFCRPVDKLRCAAWTIQRVIGGYRSAHRTVGMHLLIDEKQSFLRQTVSAAGAEIFIIAFVTVAADLDPLHCFRAVSEMPKTVEAGLPVELICHHSSPFRNRASFRRLHNSCFPLRWACRSRGRCRAETHRASISHT